jgi:hypothetical protein
MGKQVERRLGSALVTSTTPGGRNRSGTSGALPEQARDSARPKKFRFQTETLPELCAKSAEMRHYEIAFGDTVMI